MCIYIYIYTHIYVCMYVCMYVSFACDRAREGYDARTVHYTLYTIQYTIVTVCIVYYSYSMQ